MRSPALALVIAVAVAPIAAAAQEVQRPFELRAEAAHDALDNGFDDWREETIQLSWRPGRGLALLGAARATERFGQRDSEGLAGAYLPLGSERTLLHVEGSASDTHHILPRWTTLAEISRVIGDGWVATAGAKASRYDAARVRTALATLEKYVGDMRFAYTANASRLDGGSWSPSHRVTATWYHGVLGYASIAASRGREVENVLPFGLLTSNTRGASLGAGVEILPGWGLTFEWSWLQQGDLYTRRTARLGTRLLF